MLTRTQHTFPPQLFCEVSAYFQVIFESIIDADKLSKQDLSQDLENGCPKLAFVKFLGILMFKGDHNVFV